jgi:glycosyltransferase involved in cell wall biosynthesis
VIAAHNEEAIIGRTLDALMASADGIPIEVVVSANGCTDGTVAAASRPGVTVIDRPQAGKAAALNAGDEAASSFPRFYLDADIVLPDGAVARILDQFDVDPSPLVIVPARHLNTSGRPWPVRAYFAIGGRLPVFRDGIFGRGLIVVSEAGRARFGRFPEMIADDLFLDSLFASHEKALASAVRVSVETPFTSRDLLNRLARVRRGNAQLRDASSRGRISTEIRQSARWSWLRDVVFRDPRLALAAFPYVGFTLLASLMSRFQSRSSPAWGRDESTRRRTAEDTVE